jgi:glycerol uptake facilitator-like aquaporin
VSGAHLNPVVSLADRICGGLSTRDLGAYICRADRGRVCWLHAREPDVRPAGRRLVHDNTFCQLVGAAIAVGLVRLLYPDIADDLPDLIVAHHDERPS